MRKKTETRKRFGRICALVVVGMFVVMTSMSIPADDPDDWTIGGDDFGGGTTQILGTLSPDDLSIVAGGEQGIIIDGTVNPGFVGIGLAPEMFPVNQLDVAGNIAVGEGFAGQFPAPPNGMIVEGWVAIGIPAEVDPVLMEGLYEGSGMIVEGQVGIGTPEPSCALEVHGEEVWFDCDTFSLGSNTWWHRVPDDTEGTDGNYRIIFDSENSAGDYYFAVGAHEPKLYKGGQDPTKELFWIRENGNVGINVRNPTQKLHVAGSVRIENAIYDSNNDPGTSGQVLSSTGTGIDWIDAPGSGLQDLWETIYSIDDSTSTTADSPTDTLYLDGQGIASISITGDTVTITATEVDGSTTNELQNLAEVYAHDGATGNAVQLTAANGDIRFYNDDATPKEMLFLDESSGRIGIGTTTPQYKLDVVGDVHASGSFISGSTTTYGDGFITLSTGTNLNIDSGTLFIDNANDRVGIGTTSPSQKLHVAGNARITGALYDSNNQPGTSGQILQTTGSGIDWVNPSIVTDGDWDITTNPPHMFSIPTGNVGIGTMTPMNKLDVAGNMAVGVAYAGTTPAPPNGMLIEGTNGFVFPPTGGVGIGVPVAPIGFPAGQLHVDLPFPAGPGVLFPDTIVEVTRIGVTGAITPTGTTNYGMTLGIYDDEGYPVIQAFDQIFQNPNEPESGVPLYINPNPATPSGWAADTILNLNSGYVGIGTANPSQTLHVAGNARITGALYDSNNQPGTSGQILSSTVSGIDWVDPPSTSDGDWTISGNDMYSAVSGNVGIGTTSPAYKLDVNGNARVYGTLHLGQTFTDPDIVCAGDFQVDTSWDRMYIHLNTDGVTSVGESWNVHIGRIAELRAHLQFNRTRTWEDSYLLLSGDFGIGTNNPQGALDIVSTTGALIVPRMTTAQRNALAGVNGMIVYDTTANQFYFYEAGAWTNNV